MKCYKVIFAILIVLSFISCNYFKFGRNSAGIRDNFDMLNIWIGDIVDTSIFIREMATYGPAESDARRLNDSTIAELFDQNKVWLLDLELSSVQSLNLINEKLRLSPEMRLLSDNMYLSEWVSKDSLIGFQLHKTPLHNGHYSLAIFNYPEYMAQLRSWGPSK